MRKKIKAVSLIVAASLILNMFGCAQKADATIAIAMGMFACTVRMDLAAGQSDGATGQDTYEQAANAVMIVVAERHKDRIFKATFIFISFAIL